MVPRPWAKSPRRRPRCPYVPVRSVATETMGERAGSRIPVCHPPPGRNTAQRCSSSGRRRRAIRSGSSCHEVHNEPVPLFADCLAGFDFLAEALEAGPLIDVHDQGAMHVDHLRGGPGVGDARPCVQVAGEPAGQAGLFRGPRIAERPAPRSRRQTVDSPCVVTAAGPPPRTPQRPMDETVPRRRGVRRPDVGRSSPAPRTRSPRRCARSRCRTPCARDLPWPPTGTSPRASW